MKNITKLLVAFCLLIAGYGVSQEVEDTSLDETASLSKEEMVSNASAMLSEMQGTLQSTQDLLDSTREEEPDILTLNCINKNLAGIKGFVKIGEQQSENLAAKEDRRNLENSYKLILLASLKVSELGDEARNCTGESQRFADVEPSVERNVDPDIAEVDVIVRDDDRIDDAIVREREPELTPFQ